MNVNTDMLISISEANQNFSKVTRIVDRCGAVVILKNNVPRYIITQFAKVDETVKDDEEEVIQLARLLHERNKDVLAEYNK